MKTVVIVPTYNERLNIAEAIRRIFESVPDVQVLVVDDASPDGTSAVVRDLQKTYPRLELFERPTKDGLGSAYLDAFARVRADSGIEAVVMMDADLSHDPSYLPQLLRALEQFDVAIGSRYTRGGGTEGWEPWRRFLSGGGNWYFRMITRVPIRDCTGGFNVIRISMLNTLPFEKLAMFKGYAFQMALKFFLYRAGARFQEIPILFRNRTRGESKLSNQIIREGLLTPWRLLFHK